MLKDYLSASLADFFEAVSAIPRASGNERGIADYLCAFAAERGLYCYRDAANNVLIKKPASPDRVGDRAVLLQAHTDMVAEQTLDCTHDFATEGIELVQRGNLLCANGTTLGADDGFGVALMLAVLDASGLSHPPLECLFTTSEETGMDGAMAFDYSLISADRLVNLDSCDEGVITVGCCGSLHTELTLPIKREPCAGVGLRLVLRGLRGGHSGEDIHRGRANAHILMGQILATLGQRFAYRLASVSGGNKDNAIPRECVALLLPAELAAARAALGDIPTLLSDLVDPTCDPDASLSVEEVTLADAMTAQATARVLKALTVPNGVLAWRTDVVALPDASRNLAKLTTDEGAVTLRFFARAYREESLDALEAELTAFAAEVGGKARHFSRGAGWESPPDSCVAKAWRAALAKTSPIAPAVTLIHAGLECGLICAAVPGLEAISVGCNIRDLHTPAEEMELDSFERTYQTLLAFLAG